MTSAIACLALIGLPIHQDTYDLVWKPKQDQTLRYAVAMQMTVEDERVNFLSDLTLKVISVEANGDYVLESATSNGRMLLGRQEIKTPESPARREQYLASGRRKVGGQSEGDPLNRVLNLVTEFEGPQKAVAPGAVWFRRIPSDPTTNRSGSTSQYTFTGVEADALRVDFSYAEDGGSPRITGEGHFSLSATDRSLSSFDAVIRNVPVDPASPPAVVRVSMRRA